MYAKIVKIDGREITVMCCPDTPLSEVLQRAADQMRRKEREDGGRLSAARRYVASLGLKQRAKGESW